LQKIIEVKTEEKGQIEKEIENAQIRVHEFDSNLKALNSALSDLDDSIKKSEAAFSKVCMIK
jgi:predicted  nucleic acid-binding Zn-ribbon protein